MTEGPLDANIVAAMETAEDNVFASETRYQVSPVSRALNVLKCIGQSPAALSLKEIRAITGLPKTTAFRYLRTLESAGFICRDSVRDVYTIDSGVFGFLNVNMELERLRHACRPEMERLKRKIDVTVNLGVLEGTDIVYLEILRDDSFVERARFGGRDPVHTTSIGKAILAHLDGEARRAALPKVLRRRTEHSMLERRALLDHLKQVRTHGYALDTMENEERSCCVGAPIFNASGSVAGALSVSYPNDKSDELQSKLEEVSGLVIAAAARASENYSTLA